MGTARALNCCSFRKYATSGGQTTCKPDAVRVLSCIYPGGEPRGRAAGQTNTSERSGFRGRGTKDLPLQRGYRNLETPVSPRTRPAASSSPPPASPRAASLVFPPAPAPLAQDQRPRPRAKSVRHPPPHVGRHPVLADRSQAAPRHAPAVPWPPRNRRRSVHRRGSQPSSSVRARRQPPPLGAASAASGAAGRSARAPAAPRPAARRDAQPRDRQAPADARVPAARSPRQRSTSGLRDPQPGAMQNAPDPLRPTDSRAVVDRGRVQSGSLFSRGGLLLAASTRPGWCLHAEVLLHASFDFCRHVRVVLEVELGVLTPLPDPLLAVRVPRA